MIEISVIEQQNQVSQDNLNTEYQVLGEQLARRNIDIEQIRQKVNKTDVAIPSWGVGTGGTRFARFPGIGEPRHIFDKLEDCGVIHQLTCATPEVSLHIPWDKAEPAELKAKADSLNLSFTAMNSNTFQDSPDQQHSYKFGSLTHSKKEVRDQAIEHNIECIEIGKAIGSKALTVWIADGSNFPGQTDLTRQFEYYLDSMKQIYAKLPDDWRIYSEHKIFEPAFYSTVVQDWGTSYLIAQELGKKAFCLVDLGHHAPTVNIEMIVARLLQFNKLGGFHFNDSKYGDDDLDTGAIDPFRLFLVFNELVEAENKKDTTLDHMLDQSHNVTDPIESLMLSANEVRRAYAQALLVDREKLQQFQQENDVIMAREELKLAFRTDVEPILAKIRLENNGAIDPIAAYRASNYRQQVGEARPKSEVSGGGIV